MSNKVTIRLPIITIGGFLGAGKTTLVNWMLRHAEGRRFVVFVNDFGAINIDHALVETIEEDRISLTNGCVCCSLNEDLVAAVAEFGRSATPPDAIAIEASGIADPRSLDASLAALEGAGIARLDLTLNVIDADGFDALDFEDVERIIDHAAASDLVLLNKADLAAPNAIASLEKTLTVSAPHSRVVQTVRCAVDPDVLFGPALRGDHKPQRKTRDTDDSTHKQSNRYTHLSEVLSSPIDRTLFDEFAATLPSQCLRAKGILYFENEPTSSYLFNLAGRRATLEPWQGQTLERSSVFVVIGLRNKLNTVQLVNQLKSIQSA